jgi:hypothetical protein
MHALFHIIRFNNRAWAFTSNFDPSCTNQQAIERLKEKSHVWKIYQFLSVFSVFGRFSSDIRRMSGKLESRPRVVNSGS